MGICICMTESLHSSPKTTTTLLIGYTPIQNKRFKVWEEKGRTEDEMARWHHRLDVYESEYISFTFSVIL